MHPISLLLLSCCLLASPLAQANAYKCRLPGGKVEISSQPCAAGSKTESTQTGGEVSPEQRAEAEQRLQRDRELLKEHEAARAAEAARQPPPPPPAPAVPPPAPAPAVVVPGNTIVVLDPYSHCIAQAQYRVMTSRQKELHAASCRQQTLHSPGGKKDLYRVPEAKPGISVRIDKCIGKNCP